MTSRHAQLILRLAGLALATVLIQTAAVSQLSLFGATPDLAPLFVVSAGLLCGSLAGALTGFATGLLVDIALLQTLGVTSFVYVLVGHFSGRLRETVRDPQATLLPVGAGALGTLIALAVFSLLQFLLGVETPVSLELLRQIVSTVLINSLLALPVYVVVRKALGNAVPDERRRRRRRRGPGLSPLMQP